MESSILLANMMFGALFSLAVFVLARAMIDRQGYVLLAVMLATTGARFVDTTYWNASARGPVIVLMILLLAFLLQGRLSSNHRLSFSATILGACCFAYHHMAVLLVVIASAYIIASIEIHYIVPRISRDSRKSMMVWLNAALFVLLVGFSFLFFDFFGDILRVNLQDTSLFSIDPPVISVILNMAASYTNQIGFILPVAVLGIPMIVKYRTLTKGVLFLLIILIVFTPLLGNQLYISMLIAPFIAVLGVIGLSMMRISNLRRSLTAFGIFLLVVSSVMMPVWSTSRWNSAEYIGGDTVEVELDLYNDGSYLQYSVAGASAVSNTNVVSTRIAATSGVTFLGSGIIRTLSGDVDGDEVERNIEWSDAPFPLNLYKWFQYVNSSDADTYVRTLMIHGFSAIYGDLASVDISRYFEGHSNLVVVVDNNWNREYVGVYTIRPSTFVDELYSCEYDATSDQSSSIDSYMVYSSGRATVFIVDLFGQEYSSSS